MKLEFYSLFLTSDQQLMVWEFWKKKNECDMRKKTKEIKKITTMSKMIQPQTKKKDNFDLHYGKKKIIKLDRIISNL